MAKVHTLIRWHKWISWVLTLFIFIFALSGVILNHRNLVTHIDISRDFLLPSYHYKNWNQGSMVGTLLLNDSTTLIYGNAGIWYKNTHSNQIEDFNRGIPQAADLRIIRSLQKTPSGALFALTPHHLYRYTDARWQSIEIKSKEGKEHFADLTLQGDSLLVLSRSALWMALPPYKDFAPIILQAPEGYTPQASLFKTIWLAHSGALFGPIGVLIVDCLGILLMALIITGVLISVYRIRSQRNKRTNTPQPSIVKKWSKSLKWHNGLGKIFFVLLLFVTLTGMFLRPPLLITIAKTKVPILPGTSLHSENPWEDKLRKLRHDPIMGDWLLSTSEGFFSLTTWNDAPLRLNITPPVSVMGINVWERQTADSSWVVGSFSGIYTWHRGSDRILDYQTHQPVAPSKGGMPSLDNAVCGFSTHLSPNPLIVDYTNGIALTHNDSVSIPSMPEALQPGRISLWQMALEAHTGRLFIPNTLASFLYIFLGGALIIFVLLSGYIVYHKRYKKKSKS